MHAPVQEGEILAEKFRVERVLGIGGMGVVVAAHHLQLDERVALKFLLAEALESAEIVERFAREARAAAKIRSEHVARVSDVGTLPSGAPYMVMEYLEGSDLEAALEARGPLPVTEAVDLVLEALEALAEAHSLGIVHRDLKPANLFLAQRRDGSTCVKVLDFGISKMSSGAPSGATQTTAVLGTPLYMAPEQWASARNADARSDIWSIGAILYHALAGQPPFAGGSMPELWHAVANATPVPLRTSRPDVPERLDAVVARCLAKEQSARFQTVAELAGALAPFASPRAQASVERILGVFDRSGLAIGDTARANAAAARRSATGETGYGFGSATSPRSGAKVGLFALGGAALVLAAGVGYWLSARSKPAHGPAAEGLAASVALGGAASDAGEQAPAPPSASAASVEVPTAAPSAVVPAAASAVAPVPTSNAAAASSTKVRKPPPQTTTRPRGGGNAARFD